MSWDAGYGILNNTNFAITFGCSMGAVQYYENDVMPGEIFYRWPGAVYHTLFAQPTTDGTRCTDGGCSWEITNITGGNIVQAASSNRAPGGIPLRTGTVILPKKTGFVALEAGIAGHFGAKGGVELGESFIKALKQSALYVEMKNCYAGGSGTWLVLEGGPTLNRNTKLMEAHNFAFRAVTRGWVWERGVMTNYSKTCYYTKPGLPANPINMKGIKFERIAG